jgi:NAD-dependent dihydropyrimidine dehydrogenase PreA subunit
VPYVITEACVDVKDNSCVRECPVDCIYEGVRQMYVNPAECIDCGACEPVCPVEAVFYEGDLPEDQMHLADRQAGFMESFGELNGARKHGPLGSDHPDVAALPPKESE